MYTIYYINRKGAGCMRTFADHASTWTFMGKLRCPATVKKGGQVVGRIEHKNTLHPDNAGNRKWFGWLEN